MRTENKVAKDLNIQDSSIYKEFLAEREEIMLHKWLESEKAGHDVGFEKALTDWRIRHRSKWLQARQQKNSLPSQNA